MKTITNMRLEDGTPFAFSYSPLQHHFDEAVVGSILKGRVANMVNLGTSLLRKAAGNQWVAESYRELHVRVVGESHTEKWVDKYKRDRDGLLINAGEWIPVRVLVVEPIDE